MSELTIESLAAELAQADKPEQPAADSSPDDQAQPEEGAQDEAPPEVEAEAQAEAETEEGQPEQPETDSERIIKWTTASGESFEVPETELKNGYLRQQDYTRSKQELARETQQKQAEVQQQVATAQALSWEIGQLQTVTAQLQQYQQIDWQALRQQDPQRASELMTGYLILKDQAKEAEGRVIGKREELSQTQKQQFQQQSQQALTYLKERIPQFSEKTLQEIQQGCIKAGYDPKALGNVADGLLIEDLWKARQWDALQAKKPMLDNKVKGLPPATTKARPAVPPSKHEAAVKAIRERKTFSANEFASLLKSTR